LVLTMTEVHKQSVLGHGFSGQVSTIKAYVGQEGDIADPYGKNLDAYRQCARQLKELILDIGGKL